jgi:hypothetical protein
MASLHRIDTCVVCLPLVTSDAAGSIVLSRTPPRDAEGVALDGLPALLLHGVLRFVVGRDPKYMDHLYKPFMEAAERAKAAHAPEPVVV